MKNIIKSIVVIILSVLISYFFAVSLSRTNFSYICNSLAGYTDGWKDVFQYIKDNIGVKSIYYGTIERFKLFLPLAIFISCHFVVSPKKLYSFLFKYRWAVGGILLAYMVINKYNGDSLTMYDYIVQPGKGSDYLYPILGWERNIRADEWKVGAAFQLHDYLIGKPVGNNVLLAIIKDPISLIKLGLYYLFGAEYSYSFSWYYRIIITFLLNIEFFLIVTQNNKRLAFVSSMMVCFSTYYLWWGFPSQVTNIPGMIVCFYYLFKSEKKWKKYIFIFLFGYFTFKFCVELYPAWQVPFGYLFIVFSIWIIYNNRSIIKSFKFKHWMLIAGAFVLCIIIAGLYIYSIRDYISTSLNTVYPGKRISEGGYSINKLYGYISGLGYSFKEIGNCSENGICISFFPIPIILGVYYYIREKEKDILLGGVLGLSAILLVFCSTGGIPLSLAKITLLSRSTPERAVAALSYIQVVLFAIVVSKQYNYDSIKEDKSTKIDKIKKILVIIFAGTVAFYAMHIEKIHVPDYMSALFMIVVGMVLWAVFSMILLCNNEKIFNCLMGIIIVYSLITGSFIRPVSKGFDPVYSKPAAKEIISIVNNDKDAKWIAYNHTITQSYVYMCGADTINVVNKLPNFELWEKLDPNKEYMDVYNRYAHITVVFTDEDTSAEVLFMDAIQLNLSYKDLEKIDVKYIYSDQELNVDNTYVSFEKIYNEGNAFIYKVCYK